MLLRQCHCCKGDMNVQGWCELSFRIKLKNPSLSTVSVETRFDDECNKEALNTCKVFPTVIKNITWNPNSRILVMLFFGFPISPYSIQPHVTTIGYTEAHVKTSESNLLSCYIQIIKPQVDETHNHQKADSLRAPSLSKLNNMVNSNSIFNRMCGGFSNKMEGLIVHTTTHTISINLWTPCF